MVNVFLRFLNIDEELSLTANDVFAFIQFLIIFFRYFNKNKNRTPLINSNHFWRRSALIKASFNYTIHVYILLENDAIGRS